MSKECYSKLNGASRIDLSFHGTQLQCSESFHFLLHDYVLPARNKKIRKPINVIQLYFVECVKNGNIVIIPNH